MPASFEEDIKTGKNEFVLYQSPWVKSQSFGWKFVKAKESQSKKKTGNIHALLVGLNKINQQTGESFSLPVLQGAVNDVIAFSNMIDNLPENNDDIGKTINNLMLTNRDATYNAIMNLLRTVSSEAKAGDFIFVLFSGHGQRDGQGRPYFMPWDCDFTRGKDYPESVIRGEDIYGVTDRFPKLNYIFFLDTQGDLLNVVKPNIIAMTTSGQSREIRIEGKYHGLLAYQFIQFIQEGNIPVYGELGNKIIDPQLREAGILKTKSANTDNDKFIYGSKINLGKRFLIDQFEAEIQKGNIPQIHPLQWYLKKTEINGKVIDNHINIEEAWKITRGAGGRVAIIGDGIDIRHPELKDNIVATFDSSSQQNQFELNEGNNHDTATAGIIAAKGLENAGVAPEASLLSVKLEKGLGSMAEAQSIQWAADNHAQVILVNYGPADGEWWNPSDPTHNNKITLPDSARLAFEYAIQKGRNGKGCVLCYGAGNGNSNIDRDGYANYLNLITVGACNDRSQRTVYSSYGKNIWCCAPSNDFEWKPFKHPTPQTAGIRTTDRVGKSGYNTEDYTDSFGGTSAAAAMVSGVVTLILAANPELYWYEVKEIIKHSCTKIDLENGQYDADGHSIYYGYGRIDAGLAVNYAANYEAFKRKFQKPYHFYPDKKIIQQMITRDKLHMTTVSWHELLVKISKAVGRVKGSDGSYATGFLLEGGYLLTANYVLPDPAAATSAELGMNYEMDIEGKVKSVVKYSLDASDFISSPVKELNFTYVKVKDDPANPLSQWGYLEVNVEKQMQPKDSLVMISHPEGEDKKVSFEPEGVIEIDLSKGQIRYINDTDGGSGGAPILNSLLQVVGLHIGKSVEERNNYNFGINILQIMKAIEQKKKPLE